MDPTQSKTRAGNDAELAAANPLGLKLPRTIDGQPHATVSPASDFHWLLDESHSSILRQANCERAWYLGSGLERAIDVHEIAILKSLTTYGGAFGTVVHDVIRRALNAHRQILAADGRPLTESREIEFDRNLAAGIERLRSMFDASWRESFPNGRASRDHPRFVEHVKEKHELVKAQGPTATLPSTSEDSATVDNLVAQLQEATTRWRDLFFRDSEDAFRDAPRGLIPEGGLRNIDPALIIEVEESTISYLKQDTLELLARRGLSIPFYELDLAIANPPISALLNSGIPGKFEFRIRNVVDFVYLTFTPSGEPRLVAMDWKTSTLDEFTGAPPYGTQQDHLMQLKHHSLYLLQRYRDIFHRYEKEIALAFRRSGKQMPTLPRELTAEMVYVGDVYLSAGDFSARYRFKPKCAADLDLDLFVTDLRDRLTEKVRKFLSVDPIQTELQRWLPTGLKKNKCETCTQAPVCPDVPTEVRDEWPPSVKGLLERLVLPKGDTAR